MHQAVVQAPETQAVFQRTRHGQFELVCPSGRLTATQHQLLGVLTGFTPLAVVFDLTANGPEIAESVRCLLQWALIEPVTEH